MDEWTEDDFGYGYRLEGELGNQMHFLISRVALMTN